MPPKITGLILAGGKGRRMNGQDKGLVKYHNKLLIEHVLNHFIPQVDNCVISANRHIKTYQQYGYPVYNDELANYQGPLAGISTVLKYIKTDWLACVPCDAIILPPNLVKKLYQQAIQQQVLCCFAHDGTKKQPLYCLIHKNLAKNLQQWLQSGQRGVIKWMMTQETYLCDFSSQKKYFHNLNFWLPKSVDDF